MKVLLVSSKASNRGGISNWVRVITEYTKQNRQCDVDVILVETRAYKGLKHGFFERFVSNGLDIFRIKKEVKKKCIEEKPAVIHITATGEWSTFRDIAVQKVAQKMNIPVVYHTHFGKLAAFKQADGFRWKMLKKAIENSTAIWTIDPQTKAAVEDSFPNKKIEYAPNPIIMKSLPPRSSKKENSILYLGWVVKTKGIEELLEAWQVVHKEFPQYELKLVGPYDSEYMSALKEKYDFSGVAVTGRLEHSDAMNELAKTQMFILPSYTEGFPNVVLEAMALSTPIIATSVGAIPDMLDGNCGLVIEPQNAQAVAGALRTLILDSEKKDEIAMNGYQKVKAEYDIDVVMKNYKTMWNRCMEDT